jgi:ATP-binding cassette, subfamily B, bacterial
VDPTPPRSSRTRLNAFRARWSKGKAADSDRPDESQPKARGRNSFGLYGRLLRMLGAQRWPMALALASLTLSTVLRLVPPATTKFVIDSVLLGKPWPSWWPAEIAIPGTPTAKLAVLVGIALVVSLLATAFGIWGRWRATRVAKQLQVDVRRRAFEHASRLPMHRVYQLKAGGVASLLRDDAGAPGEMVFNLVYNPWRAIVQLIGGLCILIWLDWRFLLGAGLLIPFVAGSDRLWHRVLRPIFRESRKQRQEIDAKAAETFGGMRVVRAFGRQHAESTRFVRESHLLTRLELFAWGWSRAFDLFWDLLLPVASGALMLYGGHEVLAGRMTPGDLTMFLVYLAMLLEPVGVIASNLTTLQNNLSGFDRVLDLMEEPLEMTSKPGSVALRKDQVCGRIQIEDVAFRYPGSEPLVLQDINLDIEAGETVALVGRSGAGKTTLTNLVARFYDPTEGTIRIDGVDLSDVDVESYRRLLGIVEQDVFLFDGSVAENIAYADRNASIDRIKAAARAAHAAEFVEALPNGYETRIGERGVRLSGGQRQRIAIARAVLADPVLFILDEATSNLDSESERLIQVALRDLMRGRTSLVIAHRLSTIRRADRIVVLDHGRIVEIGSHEDLMGNGGRYREMVELQQLEVAEG